MQWNCVFGKLERWKIPKGELNMNKDREAIYYGIPLTFVMIVCVAMLLSIFESTSSNSK